MARPPPELARLRAEAAMPELRAPPPWQQVILYIKAHAGYMLLIIAVLFPRLPIAALVRTFRAMVGQMLSEFGGISLEAAGTCHRRGPDLDVD